MDTPASGIVIAVAARAINGSLARDVPGEQPIRPGPTLSSPLPGASGHRGERVLSLLLALGALRAAPELLASLPGLPKNWGDSTQGVIPASA